MPSSRSMSAVRASVEMRFFGGMTLEEVATATTTSTATVERELRVARVWLARHLAARSS